MLSTPPAFILSQDQTLVKSVCTQSRIAWQFCSCLLFWFDIFRCPFLKNLFKEFSGFVVYCSVINVLFLLLPFHATAFILYQSVSCLSTTFLFYFFVLHLKHLFLVHQLIYNNIPFSGCQALFSTFFTFSWSAFYIQAHAYCRSILLSFEQNGERGIRTLAPLLTTYSLSRGAPSASLGISPNWLLKNSFLNSI